MGWNDTPVQMFHFRDQKGAEVDILLESASDEVVGVELKGTATPRAEDFAGLRTLQAAVGDRFRRGLLLHSGEKASGVGKDLYALPISALWRHFPS
jgi:hypothetical protein